MTVAAAGYLWGFVFCLFFSRYRVPNQGRKLERIARFVYPGPVKAFRIASPYRVSVSRLRIASVQSPDV
jgi:hypothetical protein